MSNSSVCLTMMVKDESHVIRRCLDSVREYIDAWLIVDTGSVDETPAIIAECMAGIDGKLVRSDWRGYGPSRTESLREAEALGCEWHLILDADTTLEWDRCIAAGDSICQFAHVKDTTDTDTQTPLLLKCGVGFEYVGAAHHELVCDGWQKDGPLINATIRHYCDGATWSDVRRKNLDKAILLERELLDNPGNDRSLFHLGLCYLAAGENARALESFRRRVRRGGQMQEVYWSKLQIGAINNSVRELLEAYEMRPQRPEALVYIGDAYYEACCYRTARIFYEAALRVVTEYPDCGDTIFHDLSLRNGKVAAKLSKCEEYLS